MAAKVTRYRLYFLLFLLYFEVHTLFNIEVSYKGLKYSTATDDKGGLTDALGIISQTKSKIDSFDFGA